MDDLTTLSQDSPSQVEGTNIVSDKGSQRSVLTSVPVTHSKVEARSIEGIFNSISTNLIRKLLSHYHANGSKASIVDHIVPHPSLPAALIESIKDEDAHIPRPYPCSNVKIWLENLTSPSPRLAEALHTGGTIVRGF